MTIINALIIFFLSTFGADLLAQSLTNEQRLACLSLVKNDKSPLIGKLALGQNYPNPISVSESTTIQYMANDASGASIIFYDNSKKKKVTLVFNNLGKKSGNIKIQGNQLPIGNYTYALIVNGRIVEKKEMVVVD